MSFKFAGFSPKSISFLRQLKKNNDRDWFKPRKTVFDEVLRGPMLSLADEVADGLRGFAVGHVLPANKAVHRIYRDTRFSKDKTPYKTNISAMFPRAGLGKSEGAGFYFSLSTEGVEIAGGMYMPEPAELKAVRAVIADEHVGFAKLIGTKSLVKSMGHCQGDQLARVPKEYDPDHPAADVLRRKQFYFFQVLPVSVAMRPGLGKAIVDRFKLMTPFIDYLNRISLSMIGGEEGDGRPVRPKPMF